MPMLLSEKHPEIFHYTTGNGLSGILSSQSLRASHAAYMNDASELKTFFDRRFPSLVFDTVRTEIEANTSQSRINEFIQNSGGLENAINDANRGILDTLKQAICSFNETYIVSFCTPADDWSRKNGLLSQWRGYGSDGGYAIVFNTAALETQLQKGELAQFHYQHMQLWDVCYHDETQATRLPSQEIADAEQEVQTAISTILREGSPQEFGSLYEPVTVLSCLYKHWGFHEERESRLIAIPAHNDVIAEARKSNVSVLPEKLRNHFLRAGCLIPCISLLGNESKLPISRIIVGPHPEQEIRVAALKLLLGSSDMNAEVTKSSIPYRGQ